MGNRGPPPQRSDEEILRAIEEAYAPAQGTSDVAEKLEVERRTAEKYLKRLADEGYVATDKVGQVRVWWLTDAGREILYESEESSTQ